MTPDALSQEEIDALLKGSSSGGGGDEPAPSSSTLTSEQAECLKKYADKMAETQSDMIGTYLGETVKVEGRAPSATTAEALATKISGNVVISSFSYEGGLKGRSILLFSEKDACKIGGTMVGEADAEEFSDLIKDAFKEICNTISGNLNTSLSGEVGQSVSIKDIDLEMKEFGAGILEETLGSSKMYGLVAYSLQIGEGNASECWQVFSEELLASMKALIAPPEPEPAPAPAAAPASPQAAPVEFEPLAQESSTAPGPANLELIMDIGLDIGVELGRTNMKIRDILNLGSGSVVELDKLAGEPVDLLVNDVIFAKGEVVVIDENFGVRITEILTLQERIKTLGDLRA